MSNDEGRKFFYTSIQHQSRQKALRFERLQISFMSLICGLLVLFALAAATRLPDYWATSDYARLTDVILFNLLVIAGLVDNIRRHLCLSRLAVETK